MELSFNTYSIAELGANISNTLNECGVDGNAILTIYVSEPQFKKIDEDLFYRLNSSGEFVPSEGEIDISFDNVSIKIAKGQETKA